MRGALAVTGMRRGFPSSVKPISELPSQRISNVLKPLKKGPPLLPLPAKSTVIDLTPRAKHPNASLADDALNAMRRQQQIDLAHERELRRSILIVY